MYDLMTYTYVLQDEKPVILLFCRDKDRQRKTIAVKGFQPYFWAADPNGPERDIFGRPIRKIVCEKPSDVAKLRRKFDYHCEADIRFPLRFLIDRKIYCGLTVEDGVVKPAPSIGVPPMVVYFDIEVMNPPEKLPNPMDPQYPIVSIQCSNNYNDEIHLFTTSKEYPIDAVVHKASNERELLLEFGRWIKQMDPDVIAGYNSSNFDFPYLLRRAVRIGVPISLISPVGVAEMRKRKAAAADVKLRSEWEVHVPGRECLDLLELYQKVTGGRQGVQVDQPWGLTFDFKWVVRRETGFSYEDYGDRINNVYDTPTFLEYIRNDAVALKLLDQKCGLISYIDGLRRVVGCSLSDALRNKRLIDTFCLRIREQPLPSTVPKEAQEVAGALVIAPPRTGLFENVAVFDLKSLYPSVIQYFNISPETKDPNGEIVVGEWRYRRKPEGILPKVCRVFLEKRDAVREQLKTVSGEEYVRLKQLETLYKYLVCSIYGVAGYPGFRLFDADVANSITYMGRTLISLLRMDLRRNGYEPIYSDTDSIFVQLKTGSEREAAVVEYILQESLRKYTRQYGAVRPPEIKLERIFRRVFFKWSEKGVVKKKYAGITTKGELYLIGFEPRRSDTAELTRQLMKEVLVDILVRNDIQSARKRVIDALRNFDKYPVDQIAVPKSLRKSEYKADNPWLRGVQYSSKYLGKVFREDKRPRIVYIRKVNGYPATDVICLTEDDKELPPGFYIDYERMKEIVIRRKFEGIFQALGISWSELISGHRQTKLG